MLRGRRPCRFPRTVPEGEATISELGGSRQGPNPARELAKAVLEPLLCVSGLLMTLVGIVGEDISLEFMGAIMGLATVATSTVLLIGVLAITHG